MGFEKCSTLMLDHIDGFVLFWRITSMGLYYFGGSHRWASKNIVL